MTTCDGYKHSNISHSEHEPIPFFKSKILSITPDNTQLEVSTVAITRAPTMKLFLNHQATVVILDTGAESNVISEIVAKKLNMKISPTRSSAHQVDKSKLQVLGSVSVTLHYKKNEFTYEALVCRNIGEIMLGGNPFLEQGIIPNPVDKCIEVRSQYGLPEFIPWRTDIPKDQENQVGAAFLLRATDPITIFPGDVYEINAPQELLDEGDCEVLITPRVSTNNKVSFVYSDNQQCEIRPFPPPAITSIIGGKIRLENPSLLPVSIPRNEHIADIKLLSANGQQADLNQPNISKIAQQIDELYPKPKPTIATCQVDKVVLDPDNILTHTQKATFKSILKDYKHVFSSKAGKYNGVLGDLNARVTLNNDLVEPPSYPPRKVVQSEKMDKIQQQIMDQMEADGILGRPEDFNISVTHMHTSFIVPKMDDGVSTGEWRLVTGMQSLSPYLKPVRIQLPTVEEAFRKIAKWRFLIVTDLKHWHWQIPVQKQSLRFFGTNTPYGGERIYLVQPMGYLNANENADRVIQRVLQPVMTEGKAARIADNMITGGDSPEEAAANFRTILALCENSGITLKAQKTIICPSKITILGRIWTQGTIAPSSHIMSTISKASLPTTVKQLRGFNGAVKQMKDNLPDYHLLLQPLEAVTAGKKSAERIPWSDQLRDQFRKVQKAVSRPDILAMVKPGEQTVMFPDYSYDHQAGAAPLYVRRDGKLLKVRNFGARLKTKKRWPPCEGEAWTIRIGAENHSPWIWDSNKKCEIATDNMPCVLAYNRLIRGDFSNSVRVAYFLSTIAQVPSYIVFKPGLNHPGDYDSRHPVPCSEDNCHVCKFAFEESGPSSQELLYKTSNVIAALTVSDIDSGAVSMPFTQTSGWKDIQESDQTLSKLRHHIQGGTIPVRRTRNSELKRLYTLFQQGKITLNPKGLVVYNLRDNLGNVKSLIVVPTKIMKGLVTALHIKCRCPSRKELENIISRYWFSTSTAKTVQSVWENCDTCQSLKTAPREIFEQSSSKSDSFGTQWAADVVKADRQLIFIAREKLSNYTVTRFIQAETKDALREAIILSTAELIPGEGLLMQVDNAAGLQALVNDSQLARLLITIQLARKKNKNGNPVAEKAVQEFKQEKLKFKPGGGTLNELERVLITASLNRRVRHNKISAREIITTRDRNTGLQLQINDEDLAEDQFKRRLANHPSSAKSKVPGGSRAKSAFVWPGALVTLKKDKDKHRGREKYIVVKIDEEDQSQCHIKKMENQLRQENYVVKTVEIELCPNQVKDAPPKFGWNSDADDQESESDTEASDEAEDNEVFNDGDNSSESSNRFSDDNNSFSDNDTNTSSPRPDNQELSPLREVSSPPYLRPQEGDEIQFHDGGTGQWRDVTVQKTSARTLRRYPNYFNIQYRNGKKGSVELHQDTIWRFTDHQKQQFFWWKWGHLFNEAGEITGGTER